MLFSYCDLPLCGDMNNTDLRFPFHSDDPAYAGETFG
jgi:hypothetical protein